MNDDAEHIKTLLSYMAYYGNEVSLKGLIEKHSPESSSLNVALESAIRGKKKNTIQMLLNLVSSIDDKELALVYAMSTKDNVLFEKIYSLCGDFDTYDILPAAIRSRNMEALKCLVSKTDVENKGSGILEVCIREDNYDALSFFVENFKFKQSDLDEIYKSSITSPYTPTELFMIMKDKVEITQELASFTLGHSFAPSAERKKNAIIEFIIPYFDLSKENSQALYWSSYYAENAFVDMFFENSKPEDVLNLLQSKQIPEKHWGYLQTKLNEKQRETLLKEVGITETEEPEKKKRRM